MSQSFYTTAQAKQKEFFNSRAKYRLYGGQKWWWKSWAMRYESVRQCLTFPWTRWLALRRTTTEIEENMLNPMRLEIPWHLYKYNWSKWIMTFHNWSTLRFWYCRSLKDVLQYQGVEFDFICIEELTHWTEEEFRILMSSLRSSRSGINPNFFWSTNPWWIGHARVKRIWINQKFIWNEVPDEYEFISASVYDNRMLLDNNPEYLQALLDLPEKQRRAYLEGDRDVFEGQFFTEFRRDIHVIDPTIPMVGIKRRIISLDYWYSAPSAVYRITLDNQDQATAYREIYKNGMTYKQLWKFIKANTTKEEKIDDMLVVVDPAILNKRSETDWSSWKEELEALWLNVQWWNNSRISWWNTVHQYLKVYEDKNSMTLNSKLKITTNCVNLIRTLPELIHDERNVEDVNTKGDDHAGDALRYGLVELGAKVSSFDSVKKINSSLSKNGSLRDWNRIVRIEWWKVKNRTWQKSSKNLLSKSF